MHNERSARLSKVTEVPGQAGGRRKPSRVAQVAELLDVHESTVYKDIAAGRLRALRVGGKRGTLRILPADLDAYLESMATAETAVAS